MRVLVTGGAGYIGSHTIVKLLQEGHQVLAFDNLSNASPEAFKRIGILSNCAFEHAVADITDKKTLMDCFERFQPEAVIHFAGLKAVGESEQKPLSYYEVNLQGTLQLLQVMEIYHCQQIIFSSSATVYGEPAYLPFDEAHLCAPANTYGRTKYFSEQIIADWARINEKRAATILRYFNPVGAHESGLMGEDPLGVPNNLVPYIAQVAVGRRGKLRIFGHDYNTADGTGVRDYIHVDDLANGHIAALQFGDRRKGLEYFNLGTGKGHSVLDVVKAFEAACGHPIDYELVERRDGDIAESFASAKKANVLLGWIAKKSLEDMCVDVWRWQSQNPNGYED